MSGDQSSPAPVSTGMPASGRDEFENLVFEFFRRFARMEYALKSAGFHKRNRGYVQADWERFAKSIEKDFTAKSVGGSVSESIKSILSDPPKKQDLNGEKLVYVQSLANGSDCEKVLMYIRRVRNNLFHGGKCDRNGWFSPQRSEELMRHGLCVLDLCLKLCPRVKKEFDGE